VIEIVGGQCSTVGIPNDAIKPVTIPDASPNTLNATASTKNYSSMSHFRAPMDRRIEISRVRSVKLTNMMVTIDRPIALATPISAGLKQFANPSGPSLTPIVCEV
jgi:hypothetical protein